MEISKLSCWLERRLPVFLFGDLNARSRGCFFNWQMISCESYTWNFSTAQTLVIRYDWNERFSRAEIFWSNSGIFTCSWQSSLEMKTGSPAAGFIREESQSHRNLLKRAQWGGRFKSWLYIRPSLFVSCEWGPPWSMHPNLCKSLKHTSAAPQACWLHTQQSDEVRKKSSFHCQIRTTELSHKSMTEILLC